MMFIPKDQYEKMQKMADERRAIFIEKAKNADWAFAAMVETMAESEDFESYPEHQKQFIKEFIEARKTQTT